MNKKVGKDKSKGSKESFLLPFENLIDPAAIIDKHGRFLAVTRAVEGITGFKRRELVGRKFFNLNIMTEESKRLLKKNFSRRIAGEKIRPYEFEALTKDGTRIPIELDATLIEYNGEPAELVVFRDITERKRAEEALRERERRFRDIAENALEWIWEVDANGKYTYASPAVEKVLGYKPEEVLKKHFYDLFHPEDREELKKTTFEVFAEKQSIREFTNRNVHKNGRTVWLLTYGVPILDEKGNLLGYRGADTDITERKKIENRIKMEREVYRSLARATNQSRSVGELCELALRGIQTAIKYDMADVLVYRESENALFSAAQVGYPDDVYERTVKRQELKEDQGVAARAAREKKSVYIDDMKTSKLVSYAHDLIMKYDISVLYAVPLFSRNKLQGVLEVLTVGDKKLSKEDREVLDTISEELAGGIAKTKIEETLLTVKEAFGWLRV